jgi:hypothetical protein
MLRGPLIDTECVFESSWIGERGASAQIFVGLEVDLGIELYTRSHA